VKTKGGGGLGGERVGGGGVLRLDSPPGQGPKGECLSMRGARLGFLLFVLSSQKKTFLPNPTKVVGETDGREPLTSVMGEKKKKMVRRGQGVFFCESHDREIKPGWGGLPDRVTVGGYGVQRFAGGRGRRSWVGDPPLGGGNRSKTREPLKRDHAEYQSFQYYGAWVQKSSSNLRFGAKGQRGWAGPYSKGNGDPSSFEPIERKASRRKAATFCLDIARP